MARPSNIILTYEPYQKLAEEFYNYLLKLGYHTHTCRSHYNYLREFLSWREQKARLEIKTTTEAEIKAYYHYLSHRKNKRNGGKLSKKTCHAHIQNIKDLFMMLQAKGEISINPCSTLYFDYPSEKTSKTVLTQEEIKTLYENGETAQERAVLSMGYGCGLRVGELVNCNIEDVRLREKILIVTKGKGNKRRVVPMSSGVIKDLGNYYYKERNLLAMGRNYNAKDNAFMLNSRGGRMQKYTYNKYLKVILERTKIKSNITMHSLRHAIATHLIEQGMRTEQVRLFLGHSQLETTQRYTHISQKQLKNLVK